MSRPPAISVLMSVYNGEQHLYAAIQSILDQSFGDFEFLIIDDGSTDGSASILQQVASHDSRVRVIRRENRGLVASLNELLAAARAPLVARMDCDDISMPSRFAKQVAFLHSNANIGIVGSAMHLIDERGSIIGLGTQPDSPEKARNHLRHGPPLCHPSVMMRTEMIRSIGGYRPAFKHAEDYDLWLRASRTTEMTSLIEPLVLYRRSASQISEKYRAEQAIAAAVAWQAHSLVLAGRADPFDTMTTMPPIEDMDALLDTEGATASIRRMIVEDLRYSPEMLSGNQFSLMLAQGRSREGFAGAGRTVLRLIKNRQMARAALLGAAFLAINS